MKKIKPNITALIRGIIISAVFILFSFQGFTLFESIEKFLYSIEMRFALAPPVGAGKISMVNIDNKSIEKLGSWPWPRSYIAGMIEKLSDNGARLIGLDLDGLDRKEQNQGLSEIKDLYINLDSLALPPDGAEALKEKLTQIELKLDNDYFLNTVVKKSGKVILPAKGFNSEATPVLNEEYISIINRTKIDASIPFPDSLHEFNNMLMPFPDLASSCSGIGHINLLPEKNMAGRGHLLFLNLKNDFKENVIPSMALRLALEYSVEEDKRISFQGKDIRFAGKTIPAENGELLIRFLGGSRSFPYYSFVDIYNEDKVPPVFEDKIVLIGYTADGDTRINTPVDTSMPRVEFMANVVQALLGESFIKRPGTMIYLEGAILLLLLISFSHILPRATQVNRLCIISSLCVMVIVSGIISFVLMDIWFKTVYIFLALIVLYLEMLIRDLITSHKMMGAQTKEFKESNRMLGLSFQSQGLLDLAFEKFRKCDLDSSMKDVVYNLGLDYERKRMINKAISVYEYIANKDSDFRDLRSRIPKLRNAIGATVVSPVKGKKEEKILVVNDLEIKPTVGRYEIIREVGQGAMGIVYEAVDPKINRRIAIKTIRFSDEFEEARVQEVKTRFFREAEIAGQLSHPSIVAIYDAGEDYDLTYLAMEFIEGKDLREYCRKNRLKPLRTVIYIISEVALALDHAHGKGVIHRDIKPGNIMLLKTGKVKVTDFGIAKAISSAATKSGVVLGTPNYMSPEQINGQNIDGRSDLFSLGVVMFEMLAGELPFHGKNITNLLYQITQERHPSIRSVNPRVPKVCEQIIDRLLEKNPADRFESGKELSSYLKAVLKKIETAAKEKNEKGE
ncbi:MAG: CHASE2 domain-containing protein [Deltaproteobacteria bacterium]|nr:CHASE2 domain-containing protein [Deltaproteobacteria bacterium]